MAKAEKKISVTAFEKVLKSQNHEVITQPWCGYELKIKYTLSLPEVLGFVREVSSLCFHKEEGYLPELKDFFVRCGILTYYANFTLPSGLEHRYELVYNTDAVDNVMPYIDQKQFKIILDAIDEKIRHMCDSNISAVEREVDKLVNTLTDLQKHADGLFNGISSDDIAKISSAIANGQFSEERLVQAYADQIRGEANELSGKDK